MTTEEAMLQNGIPSNVVKRILAYWDSDKNNKAVWELNDGATRVKLATKFWNLGIPLDGLNAAITGKNKVYITWVGYKNKVLSLYPEAQFDVSLVKEGDEYSFSKESGEVIYSHKMADPFASPKIKGAYAVLKYDRGEVLETLDVETFNKMKASSQLKSSWQNWESEFWLKSVIKRVCKRAFHDEFEEIEKIDNENYDMEQVSNSGKVKVTRKAAEKNTIKEAIEFLETSETLEQLQSNWGKISREAQMNPDVVKVKNDLKVAMMEEPEA